MRDMREKVAVVTGAASGVGCGIAEVLAQEHARVVIADIDAAAAERGAATLQASGHDAIAVAADVVDRAAVDAMATQVLERYGRIDIVGRERRHLPVRCDRRHGGRRLRPGDGRQREGRPAHRSRRACRRCTGSATGGSC